MMIVFKIREVHQESNSPKDGDEHWGDSFWKRTGYFKIYWSLSASYCPRQIKRTACHKFTYSSQWHQPVLEPSAVSQPQKQGGPESRWLWAWHLIRRNPLPRWKLRCKFRNFLYCHLVSHLIFFFLSTSLQHGLPLERLDSPAMIGPGLETEFWAETLADGLEGLSHIESCLFSDSLYVCPMISKRGTVIVKIIHTSIIFT